jgi:hypothetical protein
MGGGASKKKKEEAKKEEQRKPEHQKKESVGSAATKSTENTGEQPSKAAAALSLNDPIKAGSNREKSDEKEAFAEFLQVH